MRRRVQADHRDTRQTLYVLRTDDERAALNKLRPRWGTAKDHKPFRDAIRTQLAAIAEVHNIEVSRRSEVQGGPNRSRIMRSFRRRAAKVRGFLREMAKPMADTIAAAVAKRIPAWPPPFGWSRFPDSELSIYADACDEAAKFFSGQPSRFANLENVYIVKLLIFVRRYTGKAHLNALRTLLIRPCRDKGITGQRLDQLLRDHVAKYPDVRQEFQSAKVGLLSVLKRGNQAE